MQSAKNLYEVNPHDIVGVLSWSGATCVATTRGSPISSFCSDKENSGGVVVVDDTIKFYDRVRVLKEREKMLKDCHESQPKTGFVTEESEQDRLTYYRQKLEYERFERQKVAVMAALTFGNGDRCADPYEYPQDAIDEKTGLFKQGTLRGIVRFLRFLLENTKYTTVLLQDHNAYDRVECKVFNRKKQSYRNSKIPDYNSDCLVLCDRKTNAICVAEPFKGNFSYVLLYLKFFGQYTRHPVTFAIEPSFFGGFDYNLVYRVIFQR